MGTAIATELHGAPRAPSRVRNTRRRSLRSRRTHRRFGSPSVRVLRQHLVMLTLRHSLTRLLIVGKGGGSPYAHLGARDALIALHGVGVPAGFKIAFVPHTDPIRNGYRHAEIEAEKRGLRAKVFAEEEQAIAWLTNPDMH